MRNYINLEISPAQVEILVERLPIETKIRIVRRLVQETWAKRLDTVVQRMRKSVRRAKISAKDIDLMCDEVKKEYNENHRRN